MKFLLIGIFQVGNDGLFSVECYIDKNLDKRELIDTIVSHSGMSEGRLKMILVVENGKNTPPVVIGNWA